MPCCGRTSCALLLVSIVAGLLHGCASVPVDYPRQASTALVDTDDTPIGIGLAPVLDSHPDQTGVYPLSDGLDAYVARLALAKAAAKTLDVQYYLFHKDDTGRLLAAHLLEAADRGVRVRVLLDDMDMGGRDATLAALDLHPNLEIRLFNPFPSRSLRVIDFLTHFGKVTRRMHNKSFTVDNQATIVGGRNVGDEYFDASDGTNFGDMDLLAVGPITREVSNAFDIYWNSELSLPVSTLIEDPDEDLLEHARGALSKAIAGLPDTDYGRRLLEADLVARLKARDLSFYWGEARLIYDLPEKVINDPEDRTTHLGPELDQLIAATDSELIAISPYFVPGESGTAMLTALVERGARVTVLTNSLAATDVPAVHAGYSRYRRALVEAGVELYEMPPSGLRRHGLPTFGESQASLHAKTLAIDGQRVIVGSMNLDPRSNLLNTEMGIVIEAPDLAQRMAKWRENALPEVAWRVILDATTSNSPFGQEERLVWVGQVDGAHVRHSEYEPEATLWQRIQATLLKLLPIEQQL